MMNVDSFHSVDFYELWKYRRVGCVHQKTERPARHA